MIEKIRPSFILLALFALVLIFKSVKGKLVYEFIFTRVASQYRKSCSYCSLPCSKESLGLVVALTSELLKETQPLLTTSPTCVVA